MTIKDYNRAVDEFSDGVYRFILKNLRDEDRSHDIVQDTYEKLWTKLSNVDGRKVKSYLFSTAYHTMIDVIRKEKRMGDFKEVRQEEYSHSDHYSDLNEILQKALDLLPEKQKSVVMLRDYEGYSYQEIAEITDLSESQVKVYIYRARLFLKNYIGNPERVI
ncbi:MAG: RNA polymerase sigma factor [Bacteroidales bacterium]|nr:RNA polymerase sigma factor [Bacteroidales bacterium]MCF8389653.1 RNA polymerase sigma factor [Bacteroidales bacterium]